MSNDYFEAPTPLSAGNLARASHINSRMAALEAGFELLPDRLPLFQNRLTYLSAGGTADAITVTLDPVPAAYVEGLRVVLKIASSNTGAATINVNALGNKSIKRPDGTALQAGDLTAGNVIDLVYDGTNFKIVGSGIVAAQAAAAAASAAAAATSATNAATSATAAAASATAAATSASNAATSATAAATAETNAETAETNAETAETNAETAATAAAASATAAAASATAAAGSATTATTQATNASTSATNAATSATNAATSATAAATAETNAETAETNAETAETNAAASAAAAAASAASINPANLMHLTGDETAAGVKTFSGIPVLSGGGIKFPATQVPSADANTLDDYEEGTWTPTLAFGGGSTGLTYSATRSGRYTKIGRLVNVQCEVILTAKGSSTGLATLSGLPYASTSGQPNIGPCLLSNMSGMVSPMASVGASSSSVIFFDFETNVFSQIDNSAFTNTSNIYVNLTYYTA